MLDSKKLANFYSPCGTSQFLAAIYTNAAAFYFQVSKETADKIIKTLKQQTAGFKFREVSLSDDGLTYCAILDNTTEGADWLPLVMAKLVDLVPVGGLMYRDNRQMDCNNLDDFVEYLNETASDS